MPGENDNLIAEIKENLIFLKEIGVTGIDADLSAFATQQVQKNKPEEAPVAVRSAPPENLVPERRARERIGAPPQIENVSRRSMLDEARLSKVANTKLSSASPSSAPINPVPKPENISAKATEESLFEDQPITNQLAPSVESLEDVRSSTSGCTACRLSEGRTQIVNSTGNPKARLMFIGEAPGADEDAQGKPFVGRAGQLLTKIIEAMGIERENVFIGNINRCRPPGNRAPQADEVKMCKPYLLREIAVVRPEVIVVLGNTAMQNLLEVKTPIGKLRGNFQDYFGIPVMPTFHPAYLLRDPNKKREVWEDMKKVKAKLETDAV